MSALREPRRQSPTQLIAAAKSAPLPWEEWKKFRDALPDSHVNWGYKGSMVLGAQTESRTNHTPTEWRRAGIETDGKKFKIVTLVSRMDFSATDLRLAKLDPELKITGLALAQALKTGAAVDAAMRRLHGEK